MGKMKEIRVTNIDPELHKQFKTACTYFGCTMQDAMLVNMEATVERHRNVVDMGIMDFGKTKNGGKKA